jgi:hypothetical protein
MDVRQVSSAPTDTTAGTADASTGDTPETLEGIMTKLMAKSYFYQQAFFPDPDSDTTLDTDPF